MMTMDQTRTNNYKLTNDIPMRIYHMYSYLLKWGFRQEYIRVYIHTNGHEYTILHKEAASKNAEKWNKKFVDDISLQFLVDCYADKEQWPKRKNENVE